MSDDQHLIPELAIRLEWYRLEHERDEARRALDVARAKHDLDARVWHERDKRAALDLFAANSDLGRALKRAEDRGKELDETRARLAMTRQERDEFLRLNEQEAERAARAESERDAALSDAEAKTRDANDSESALAQMQSALERAEAARDEAERARDAVMADRDFLLVRVNELRAALTRAEVRTETQKGETR